MHYATMCAIKDFLTFELVLAPLLLHAVGEIRYWRWTQSVFAMLLSVKSMPSSVNVAQDPSASS